MNIKNQRGVTLIALLSMVILLIIIVGVSMSLGFEVLDEIEKETITTNLMLIEAKARESVEEANFKMGVDQNTLEAYEYNSKLAEVRKEIYEEKAKLDQIPNTANIPESLNSIPRTELYILTEETKQIWGLEELKTSEEDFYFIKFDEKNLEVEIYNSIGYKENYSLTQLENI